MSSYARSRSRREGFTLLEVVFAVGVLTIAALMLTSALSSSERMTSLARERAIANNAIRAYIERLRSSYPPQNAQDMTSFLMLGISKASGGSAVYDTTLAADQWQNTPLYDLHQMYTSGLVERGVLKNVICRVSFCTDETGANWGFMVSTDQTGLGGIAVINSPTTASMSSTDKAALGLPRDLNVDGNNTTTDTLASNGTSPVTLVPIKIDMFWLSGASRDLGATQKPQQVTVYAIFSPQH